MSYTKIRWYFRSMSWHLHKNPWYFRSMSRHLHKNPRYLRSPSQHLHKNPRLLRSINTYTKIPDTWDPCLGTLSAAWWHQGWSQTTPAPCPAQRSAAGSWSWGAGARPPGWAWGLHPGCVPPTHTPLGKCQFLAHRRSPSGWGLAQTSAMSDRSKLT